MAQNVAADRLAGKSISNIFEIDLLVWGLEARSWTLDAGAIVKNNQRQRNYSFHPSLARAYLKPVTAR
ncbi:MAG: hypothetical protein H7A09_00090 [Oceanospirillaceae bacterium]|nr:hypothetical protein [Oceanospirillaceae bacterium]